MSPGGALADGYVREPDGSLVHYIRGAALDRHPPGGRLAFLVEELDHAHDRMHRHGTPGFVEAQRHEVLRKARGVSPSRLKVVEVDVDGLDDGDLEAVNAHMCGNGRGLLRERLAAVGVHYPRF